MINPNIPGDVMQPPSSTAPIQAIAATASPMTYIARDHGTLSVQAGAVSAITLARGASSIAVGAGLIPLSIGDKVTVTYTTAPTLNFIPR